MRDYRKPQKLDLSGWQSAGRMEFEIVKLMNPHLEERAKAMTEIQSPQPAPALTDEQIAAAWKAWPELGITSAAKAIRFVRAVLAHAAIPAPEGDERAAFEAKFGKHQKWCDPEIVATLNQPLCETLVGKYIFNDIQKAWEAWQARASLAAQPVMSNGLTEAETNETASVKGLINRPSSAEEDDRTEFETAYAATYPASCRIVKNAFQRDPECNEEYDAKPVQIGWEMWQAARASKAQPKGTYPDGLIVAALELASRIADRVPTRVHLSESADEAFRDIGRMVNAQDDGTHGYRLINDALEAAKDCDHALLAIMERAGEGSTVADVLDRLSATQSPAPAHELPAAQALDGSIGTRIANILHYADKLREQTGAETEEEGWCVRIIHSLEYLRTALAVGQGAPFCRDRVADLVAKLRDTSGSHINGRYDAKAADMLEEIALLADSEGTRAVEYLRRARKAEAALASQAPAVAHSQAALDVLAERRRQIEVEGWTPGHDDLEHDGDELARAAAVYANPDLWNILGVSAVGWPWEPHWFKPTEDRRNWVKAAALLLAAIEQKDRASQPPVQPMGGA